MKIQSLNQASNDDQTEINDEYEDEEEERALREAVDEGAIDFQRDDGDSDDYEHGEESGRGKVNKVLINKKALVSKLSELERTKKLLPWSESFDIVTSQPLPFSKKQTNGVEVVSIHDDLKREVAFYNCALEGAEAAKNLCKQEKIKFTRPDDFFAEMVKSDDHMAKVKDRLIFESKKIEAFEQRKANTEQRLRSKEVRARKKEEKDKMKRENLRDVNNWAKSTASTRLSGGIVRDKDDDEQYLSGKKRKAMDKKFGFGGKRGRFKQTNPKALNDFSNYNVNGKFGGTKKSGAKRIGKRARDAVKQNKTK